MTKPKRGVDTSMRGGEDKISNKLNNWRSLFEDAKAKRGDNFDDRVKRRRELYKGSNVVRDLSSGGRRMSTEPAYCLRNMCFELIETQVNNAISAPKVTPRDMRDIALAHQVEAYLKAETDRLDFETVNDAVERECYIQGTAIFHVGWDNMDSTPTTSGEIFVKYYPLERFYPQPGVYRIADMEYCFTEDLVSVHKIKREYGVDIPEGGTYRGMNTLITAWYLNDDGYLSRYGWVDTIQVFDDEGYELRRFRKCKKCLERVPQDDICPTCGSDKFGYYTDEFETLEEDVKTAVVMEGEEPQEQILARAGDSIPYYTLRCLPFVCRRNISDGTSFYGLSDIDTLEEPQEAMNKVMTKMQENILKSGAVITIPPGVKVPNTNDTLRILRVKNAADARNIDVKQLSANTQQDDIFQDRLYQSGRGTLGITESYQGKRDPTAESGKAKEIAAAQSSGRLESKRRMKDAAYADLYALMFKFLLAYCDESRSYATTNARGEPIENRFSRYNFLAGTYGDVYYNDRFLFSVDIAASLSTNREAMWKESVNNFRMGTFGNPADPRTLVAFWKMMYDLNYPFAKEALSNIQSTMQELPYDMQQAIIQNPQILQAVQQALSAPQGGEPMQEGGATDVPSSQ